MRKGFTLVELLIVVAVISALAAMTTYEAAEFSATAKTRVILSNMLSLKKAVLGWYATHRDAVYKKDGHNYVIRYSKNINSPSTSTYPIQELWEDRSGSATNIDNNRIGSLKMGGKAWLGKYLENPDDITVSGTSLSSDKSFYSPIVEDGYLLHDNDTATKGSDGKYRTAWYVGYAVPKTKMGERIKKRLASMAKSNGLLQRNRNNTNADNIYTDSDIVWMQIIKFED